MRSASLVLSCVVVVLLTVAIVRQDRQIRERPPSLSDIRAVVDSATEKVNLKIENDWSNRTMTTTINWKDADGGTTATVVPTERMEGESTEKLWARHQDDIDAVKAGIAARGGTIL